MKGGGEEGRDGRKEERRGGGGGVPRRQEGRRIAEDKGVGTKWERGRRGGEERAKERRGDGRRSRGSDRSDVDPRFNGEGVQLISSSSLRLVVGGDHDVRTLSAARNAGILTESQEKRGERREGNGRKRNER
eukprot:380502-Hanusia_phi.AAC.2